MPRVAPELLGESSEMQSCSYEGGSGARDRSSSASKRVSASAINSRSAVSAMARSACGSVMILSIARSRLSRKCSHDVSSSSSSIVAPELLPAAATIHRHGFGDQVVGAGAVNSETNFMTVLARCHGHPKLLRDGPRGPVLAAPPRRAMPPPRGE
jgi:hypothetical protein